MNTNNQDPQLSRLLKQWPAPEPRPTFEQDVLRRLRQETAQPPATGLWSWLPEWVSTPGRLAWTAAAPLAAALMLGIASAWVLPPAETGASLPLGGFSVLERGTVAGNYIAMTEGR